MDDIALGFALANIRRAKRLTQVELAVRMHCSQGRISQMERGRVGISLRAVDRWLRACGASDDERRAVLGIPAEGAA